MAEGEHEADLLAQEVAVSKNEAARKGKPELWEELLALGHCYTPLQGVYRLGKSRAVLRHDTCAMSIVPWSWEGWQMDAEPFPDAGKRQVAVAFQGEGGVPRAERTLPLGELALWAHRKTAREWGGTDVGCPKPLGGLTNVDVQLVLGVPFNRCWVRELLGYPSDGYGAAAPVHLALWELEHLTAPNNVGLAMRCGEWAAMLVQVCIWPTGQPEGWEIGIQPL